MTKATVKVIKKRNQACSTHRKPELQQIQITEKTIIKRDKNNYQRHLIDRFKDHPKLFYDCTTNMNTVRTRVPNITKQDRSLTTTNSETASVLCDYFSITFVQEKDLDITENTDCNPLTITVTRDHVLKLLLKLRSDKSPGPDNIQPMFLRATAQNIAEPLSLIFQKSLEDGVVPED